MLLLFCLDCIVSYNPILFKSEESVKMFQRLLSTSYVTDAMQREEILKTFSNVMTSEEKKILESQKLKASRVDIVSLGGAPEDNADMG